MYSCPKSSNDIIEVYYKKDTLNGVNKALEKGYNKRLKYYMQLFTWIKKQEEVKGNFEIEPRICNQIHYRYQRIVKILDQ